MSAAVQAVNPLCLRHITEQVQQVRQEVSIVDTGAGRGVLPAGAASGQPVLGTLPALYPEWLGEQSFRTAHGVRFPYIAGEMAGGIATTRMVIAMAEAEMLGFFGAAGLAVDTAAAAVAEIRAAVGQRENWGVNLIHLPGHPAQERAMAEMLLHNGVRRISASAFMNLTPAVVRCAATGLRADRQGGVHRERQLLAKVSRPEVAEAFLRPAPRAILDELVARGELTAAEAELAVRVPVATDLTVESDSGGHTDNRPLGVILPVILALRDELGAPVRIGAAGGLGTPAAVAAAFGMGAAYVVTGSVNQVAIESGLAADARAMLAAADVADIAMAPAGDMFELGAKVQVLRTGTMFAARATRLYEVYRGHAGLDELPEDLRNRLERDIFRAPLTEIWAHTREYWAQRDPAEVERAEREPKHRMSLVFRWYLGNASRWAVQGETSRRADYQIWCGPAMGAFNRWTKGTFLGLPANRSVVQIARNLMEGAAVTTRAQQLRAHGVAVPPTAFAFTPRQLA